MLTKNKAHYIMTVLRIENVYHNENKYLTRDPTLALKLPVETSDGGRSVYHQNDFETIY